MRKSQTAAVKSCAIFGRFALALGLLFPFGGGALAQDKCSTVASKGWSIDNPSDPSDRQAILDLLYRYAWTIDDRDAVAFSGLFAQPGTSYYEICNTGGSVMKLTLGLSSTSPDDLRTQMTIITGQLAAGNLQTRHLVTNTVFDVVDDTTVNTRSIVLVTIQDSHSSAPVLDYSGDARATFLKSDNNTWLFQSLTIHTDNGAAVAKKR
jgi:hypothetical protein